MHVPFANEVKSFIPFLLSSHGNVQGGGEHAATALRRWVCRENKEKHLAAYVASVGKREQEWEYRCSCHLQSESPKLSSSFCP